MRIISVRALRECVAPELASAHLSRSVSQRYMRSSEAAGEAPRAAQPGWRALKSDGVRYCNERRQNMHAMPNRLYSYAGRRASH